MDYVSYISQELGFSLDKTRFNSITTHLFLLNNIANHLLNTACTVADSGALGAILWCFEIRELIAEDIEYSTGARLHVNLAFAVQPSQEVYRYRMMSIIDIILSGVINVRISRSRLAHNFLVTAENASQCGLTG